MRKSISIAALSAVVTLVAAAAPAESTTASRTSSSACDHIGDKNAAIRDFVEGIKKDWKLDVRARDYEIRPHGRECVIQPRGARPVTGGAEARSGASTTSMTTVETMPVPATSADGDVTIQQEVAWQQPSCYEWEDAERIGWMRACGQWGRTDYAEATHKNYAFRMYASCHAQAGHPFDQVSECYVAAEPFGNDPNIVWNDWDPKATLQFDPCGSTLPIGLSVGPFSTTLSITSCDKIVPSDSARPGVPDLRATWKGKSYYAEDVRQTAALVAFGAPKSYQSSPSLYFRRGFTHEECVWPPTPSPYYPWCAI
ncbi:hypothetical protein [Streptosporangium sp. NPDC048865]|uniref:hypothetical protein n=1 Tax=Streptosporangium sp. NPDC048865 TaxID=3155766 RepID=UPI003421D9F2